MLFKAKLVVDESFTTCDKRLQKDADPDIGAGRTRRRQHGIATAHTETKGGHCPPERTTMGTRSLTHIKDQDSNKTLVTLYRQYDGYPTGMGKDIKDILAPLQLVNGYSGDRPQANGMGCAAAQLIAGLKDGCGNVYIYPTNSKDCWEDYVYTIRAAGDSFRLTVQTSDKEKLFDGLINDFYPEKVEGE